MSSSGNNPRNPQKAPEISWQGLNLRKHLKFISETLKYAFVRNPDEIPKKKIPKRQIPKKKFKKKKFPKKLMFYKKS